jgi:glycosyltransferase involved in cell wall biosynthesis
MLQQQLDLSPEEAKKPVMVSVVVPVYHGKGTIRRCLDSIKRQKYSSMELLIIDDASEDGSTDIIKEEEFTSDKDKVSFELIVHKTNLGIAATLNEAFQKAKGDYVFVVHQDCELLGDDFMDRIVESLESEKDVAVVCGRAVYPIPEFSFFERVYLVVSNHTNQTPSSSSLEEISFAEHKCDLFVKKLMLDAGGFDSKHFRASAEDQILSFNLKSQGYKIVRDNRLAYIQRYGGSMTTALGIMKKLNKYGKTQAEVMRLTRAGVVRHDHMTPEQRKRFINRISTIASATIIVLAILFSIAFRNILLLAVPVLLVAIWRSSEYILRARNEKLFDSAPPLLLAGLCWLMTDFSYSVGFYSGLLSFAKSTR